MFLALLLTLSAVQGLQMAFPHALLFLHLHPTALKTADKTSPLSSFKTRVLTLFFYIPPLSHGANNFKQQARFFLD